jgi:hypothetical protein
MSVNRFPYIGFLIQKHHHHHQPINVPAAGAQAFLMSYPQEERASERTGNSKTLPLKPLFILEIKIIIIIPLKPFPYILHSTLTSLKYLYYQIKRK